MFVRIFPALTAFAMIVHFAGSALATPPDNDDCGNATAITLNPFNQELDTTDATGNANDPDVYEVPYGASV